MTKATSDHFMVNDILIDYGQAFRVTKIEDFVNTKGIKDRLIHFHSYFYDAYHKRLYCTIPQSNLISSPKRKPISIKDAKAILSSLSRSADPIVSGIDQDLENTPQLNDIFLTSAMVKQLWQEKHDPQAQFSNTKETLYESGLEQLTEELAVVLGTNIKDMRRQILSALKA